MTGTARDQMVEKLILYAVLGFSWTVYLWKTYIAYRQRTVYRNVQPELEDFMDNETFEKSRLYWLDQSNLTFWSELYTETEGTLILFLGGIPFLWRVAGSVTAHFGFGPDYEISQSLVFVSLASLFFSLTVLPGSIYNTFVIEEKHGFNRQTLAAFLWNTVIYFVFSQFCLWFVIGLLLYIIRVGGDYFFIYAWLSMLCVFLMFLTLVSSILSKVSTTLPDGQLKTEVETMAKSAGFPLAKISVLPVGKSTAHSNALLYGLYWNKSILLFDTLLEDYSPLNKLGESESLSAESDDTPNSTKRGCNNPQVLAVLAHELGHWKHSHIVKKVIILQMYIFLCLILFAVLIVRKEPFLAFGFHDIQPTCIGFVIIFGYVLSPVKHLLLLSLMALSRRFELQADAFAQEMGKGPDLQSALVKLHSDNLLFPVTDWLFSMWNDRSPPLLERITALDVICFYVLRVPSRTNFRRASCKRLGSDLNPC